MRWSLLGVTLIRDGVFLIWDGVFLQPCWFDTQIQYLYDDDGFMQINWRLYREATRKIITIPTIMRYIYYKLWQSFIKIKTNDMPATNALIFLSGWLGMNLLLVISIIKRYSLINLKLISCSASEIYAIMIILFSILTLLNYFFLYKKREKILQKYINESRRNKMIGNILLIVYIIGTLVLLCVFVWWRFPWSNLVGTP